jgi:hypothetical protein
MYAVINTTNFLDHNLDHIVHGSFIGDINLDHDGPKIDMFGIFLAFFRRSLRVGFVDICKDNSFNTYFGKGKRGLFPDSSTSLCWCSKLVQKLLRQGYCGRS